MSEGHSGHFEKGHHPTAGELQARAAEKIIQDAQRNGRQSNLGKEGAAGASASARARELDDKYSQEKFTETLQYLKYFDTWKKRDFHKNGEHQTSEGYPRIFTPNGVAHNPQELAQLSEAWLKESDKNFERQRLEAIAKINATKRLPWKDRMWLLITGMPPTSEEAQEILQEERMKLGL